MTLNVVWVLPQTGNFDEWIKCVDRIAGDPASKIGPFAQQAPEI